jgi:hypothetical protein
VKIFGKRSSKPKNKGFVNHFNWYGFCFNNFQGIFNNKEKMRNTRRAKESDNSVIGQNWIWIVGFSNKFGNLYLTLQLGKETK